MFSTMYDEAVLTPDENKDRKVVTARHIEKSMTYQDYRKLTDELLAQGKTTGNDHSDTMLRYTSLNKQRMKRLDKTIEVSPEIKSLIKKLKSKWIWLVLCEAWCDDCAQTLPVLFQICKATTKIDLRILLRDENPILMDNFLTGESRSIPKLICVDRDTLDVLDVWGPRPKPAQDKVMMYRSNRMVPYEEFMGELQLWYAKDKAHTLQQELVKMIKNCF